eukprot:XP_028346192.1 nucleoprotein TPR-like [Physeter catodon]
MAARKSLSPMLELLLAAVASFDLPHQFAACHALQRQTPLTMSTAFPPSTTRNDKGTAGLDYATREQCLDLLDKQGDAALAAISPSKGLERSSSDEQLYRRGEAQRCLLPSHGSLMRQQQQLGPEAGDFPCASKRLMAAAPPPATLQKQRQQRHGQQQPLPSELEQHQKQQQLEQRLRQKRLGRQQNQRRDEVHPDVGPASNIAFNWRSSPSSSAASDSSQGVQRSQLAATTSGESAAAVEPREEVAADASSAHATASGEGKQQNMSFFEAMGHAAAAEAAALVGGTWDWSTWGIGGLQSTSPASARVKQTTGAASADAGSAAVPPVAAAKITVGTANDVAEAPAAATAANKSAGDSVSGLGGSGDVASVAAAPPAVPVSTGGQAAVAAVENPAAAREQERGAAAKSELDGKSGSSRSNESWWGGKTWTDAIGSFFKKLDQRIEDAQGVLSHSDLYEFSL